MSEAVREGVVFYEGGCGSGSAGGRNGRGQDSALGRGDSQAKFCIKARGCGAGSSKNILCSFFEGEGRERGALKQAWSSQEFASCCNYPRVFYAATASFVCSV